jgi:hypothetical protein
MKKNLTIAYSIILILIVIFPPWTCTLPISKSKTFIGFYNIFSGPPSGYACPTIMHGTFLFLEILALTLIFAAFLYLKKNK